MPQLVLVVMLESLDLLEKNFSFESRSRQFSLGNREWINDSNKKIWAEERGGGAGDSLDYQI